MSRLRAAAGEAPFVFIVGKGGTGKTTTAGALALELADAGADVHLISTDPAHSLADLFGHPIVGSALSECSPRLRLEELDADAAAEAWVRRALGPVSEIIERGTWLDGADVQAFGRLALPGVDEMVAVLRLAGLASGDARVVVDTAPTGHLLRLLDAADLHAAIARTLRAMAAKADAVAGAMTGRDVRLAGEAIIDELETAVDGYRARVLAGAAFIVVTRPGAVVAAETERLLAALDARRLRVAAILGVGAVPAEVSRVLRLCVPGDAPAAGCAGLRRWREGVGVTEPGAAPVSRSAGAATARAAPSVEWLSARAPRLLLFAGKGGVGKSTCAAAAALVLAEGRDVLLCGTDPAGSLADVLGADAPDLPERLRVLQVEPAAELESLRASGRTAMLAALERLGLSDAAVLDRRVLESIWDLAPPGLDEMAAIAALLRGARSDETIVIDSAPTGHFLRLLEMPDIALGWTRQLMRVFVKYGVAAAAEDAAAAVLRLARELRQLRDDLRDPAVAAVVVVTLDQPMVAAETARLLDALHVASVAVLAVIRNRSVEDHLPEAAAAAPDGVAAIAAPVMEPPPRGAAALRGFIAAWNIVS